MELGRDILFSARNRHLIRSFARFPPIVLVVAIPVSQDLVITFYSLVKYCY